jgi:hypothetical protein
MNCLISSKSSISCLRRRSSLPWALALAQAAFQLLDGRAYLLSHSPMPSSLPHLTHLFYPTISLAVLVGEVITVACLTTTAVP